MSATAQQATDDLNAEEAFLKQADAIADARRAQQAKFTSAALVLLVLSALSGLLLFITALARPSQMVNRQS